eukprot:g7758.t1
MRASLIERGFLIVDRKSLWGGANHREWATGASGIKGLARAVLCLAELGLAPSFILVYDEAWLLQHAISKLVADASGGNAPIGDFYAFCVKAPGLDGRAAGAGQREAARAAPEPEGERDAPDAKGWPPHRDRVIGSAAAVAASFRAEGEGAAEAEGTSKYITAWVALTDATPESSCLYAVPREHDPGYAAGDSEWGSPTEAVFHPKAPAALQNIVALTPAPKGTLLLFTHRLLHWGSRPLRGARAKPRVALSFAFADPRFEPPYLRADAAAAAAAASGAASLPAHAVRMALVAGQAIRYVANEPLEAAMLDTLWEVFERSQDAFDGAYVRNVRAKANWARFKHKQQAKLEIHGAGAVADSGKDIDLIFAAFEASKE